MALTITLYTSEGRSEIEVDGRLGQSLAISSISPQGLKASNTFHQKLPSTYQLLADRGAISSKQALWYSLKGNTPTVSRADIDAFLLAAMHGSPFQGKTVTDYFNLIETKISPMELSAPRKKLAQDALKKGQTWEQAVKSIFDREHAANLAAEKYKKKDQPAAKSDSKPKI